MPAHKTINTRSRLAGHTLPNEGRLIRGVWTGSTVCSCGAVSEILNSDNARKAWHREHKKELIARGALVKAKLISAHGGRFGPGHVHLGLKAQSPLQFEYEAACAGRGFYGDVATGTLDKVDCAHCRQTKVFKELLHGAN